jgi:hypothetical protein
MNEPIKLKPRNLREVWDEIKPGLQEVKEAWPELSTWRVEDVYAAVLQEQAVIYTTEDGFAVCTLETDEYSLQSDLCIWIAYANEKSRGGMLKKYLTSFIAVAKSLGCSGVTTKSNHLALVGMTELKPVYTHYRVAVDGEEAEEAGTDSSGD